MVPPWPLKVQLSPEEGQDASNRFHPEASSLLAMYSYDLFLSAGRREEFLDLSSKDASPIGSRPDPYHLI